MRASSTRPRSVVRPAGHGCDPLPFRSAATQRPAPRAGPEPPCDARRDRAWHPIRRPPRAGWPGRDLTFDRGHRLLVLSCRGPDHLRVLVRIDGERELNHGRLDAFGMWGDEATVPVEEHPAVER